MKRLHLFGVLLLVAGMSACSENEWIEEAQNPNNAIQFGVSAGKQTRGLVVDNDGTQGNNINTKGNTFGLFAYYTGQAAWSDYSTNASSDYTENTTRFTLPNLMNNQEVTFNGSDWTYSPLKYWSNTPEDKVSFFAYYPYQSSDITVTSGQLPAITFTQKMSAADMIDFIVAHKLDEEKQTTKVSLPFKHVLTRVNVTGKMSAALDANTQVFVKSLKVSKTDHLYSAATYKLGEDIENSSWDYIGATKATTALSTDGILAKTTPSWGGYTESSVGIPTNGTTTNLFQTGEYLFLIPPGGKTGTAAEGDIQFEVEYDVVTKDKSLSTDVTNQYIKISTTATVKLAAGTLIEGKAYNVELTFDLDAIEVAANVGDWADEEKLDYVVENVAGATTYTVYTADGLQTVNTLVQSNLDANITLGANITLSAPEDSEKSHWTAIGTSSQPYTGTFNGQGHSITGITMDVSTPYQGLIGYLGNTGKVQNLKLIDCEITSTSTNVGGITGYNAGEITNCEVSGSKTIKSDRTVTTDNYNEHSYVGAIAGQNVKGTISQCKVSGSVNLQSSNSYVGGITGHNKDGEISGCTVGGLVKVGIVDKYTFVKFAGGIVGYNDNGKISKCGIEGTVAVDSKGNDVGGIAGLSTGNSEISECTVSGSSIKVIASSSYAGGIVGENLTSKISQCKVSGSVTVQSTANYVGGIVGQIKAGSEISECTISGSVTVSSTGDKGYVGGIAGAAFNSSILDCMVDNTDGGEISISSRNEFSGGIAGQFKIESGDYGDAVVRNCHVIGTDSEKIAIGGTMHVGGIIGDMTRPGTVDEKTTAYLLNCSINYCSIEGTEHNVGGIVGYSSRAIISGCSAKNSDVTSGTATGTDEQSIGGIVGRNTGTIIACYANNMYVNTLSPQHSGDNKLAVGAIVGRNAASACGGNLISCYSYNCTTSNSDSREPFPDERKVVGINTYKNSKVDNFGTIISCYYFTTSGNIAVTNNEREVTFDSNELVAWGDDTSGVLQAMNGAITTWNDKAHTDIKGDCKSQYKWDTEKDCDKAELVVIVP